MMRARFTFTKYYNYFNVHIDNLEKLSVEQIKEIELFVKNRKGVFNFETYSFAIQKRLEFYEFVVLIQNSTINAQCIEKERVVKEKKRIGFGQYKGMFYTDLTDSYILWLKSNYHGRDKIDIEEELKKRSL